MFVVINKYACENAATFLDTLHQSYSCIPFKAMHHNFTYIFSEISKFYFFKNIGLMIGHNTVFILPSLFCIYKRYLGV